MNNTVPLAFTPILTFDEFLKTDLDNEYGVYVWGFRFPHINNGQFIPYYVGEAGARVNNGGSTTIKSRITNHYNLAPGNYNIIKKEFLPDFYSFIRYDSEIRKMDTATYESYKDKFAYLNYERINGTWIQRNCLKSVRAAIALHITNYQDHFHACCVTVPPGADRHATIAALERHVNYHMKHAVVGKKNKQHYDDLKIDCSALGKDNFWVECPQ